MTTLKWIAILLTLFYGVEGVAQQTKPDLQKNRQGETMEFSEECEDPLSPGKFRIRLLGQIFKHNDRVYICPDLLPQEIEIFHEDGWVVSYPEWSGASFSDPLIALTTLLSLDNDFGGKIRCTIITDMTTIEVVLQISTEALPVISQDGDNLAYDDNQIKKYEGQYNTQPEKGIPWKYLNYGENGIIEAVTKKSKFYYSAFLKSASAYMTITPSTFGSDVFNSIALNFNNRGGLPPANRREVNVFNCDEEEVFLKAYVGDKRTKTVNFLYLCNDYGSGLICPSLNYTTINSLMQDADQVLKQVGVSLTLNNIYNNIDLRSYLFGRNPDYIITPAKEKGTINEDEQRFVQQNLVNNNAPFFDADILVLIAENLSSDEGETTIGRALNRGVHPIMLAINAKEVRNGGTLAHEIGHALFEFLHPRDRTPSATDSENFMYYTSSGRKNNIRRYQFDNLQTK
jgi:hypothetical protein